MSFLDRNEPITTSVQQPGRFLSVRGCASNQLTEWKAIRQEREPTSWGERREIGRSDVSRSRPIRRNRQPLTRSVLQNQEHLTFHL